MKRIGVWAACLLAALLLSACDSSQTELDGVATQVAAAISATRSAAGPVPLPTLTPVPPTAFTLEADGSGDYATLVEAVRSVPEGATLILGPGVYRLTGRLYVRRSLHLVGAGMGRTEIVSEAEGYVIRFSGDGPFSAEDVTFRHQGEAAASVVVVRGGEAAFARCRFTGATVGGERDGVGLWIKGETDGVVRDCVGDDNGNIGLLVGGRARPTLEGNRFTNNTAVGVAYRGEAGGVARRNQCSGSMVGISLSGQADPTLEENQCNDNDAYGIFYLDETGGQASRNECLRNGTGILVVGRAQPALEGNLCNDNDDSGIGYRDNAGGSASENECSRNGYHGIYVYDQAWPALKGNVCTDNQDTGISYFDNAAGLVSENECVRNGKYGIAVQITANPTLMSNDCHDNGLGDVEHTH